MIKRKSIIRIAGIVCLQLLLLARMQAQPVSPFNGLAVKDSSAEFSFLVSGHFHGASTNISGFPAASLQASIDTLNALHPAFLMSLGDLFLDVNDTYIAHYRKSLFNKLKMPLFNSVGNHDLANGNMYEKVFGREYFSFTLQGTLIVVLNTEEDNGSIKGDQFGMLKEAIGGASAKGIKNIFIFSHRPVWAESIPKYEGLFEGNTRSVLSSNFNSGIKPLLSAIPKNIHTFWCSGSMGGTAPASFFYDRDEGTGVTFMQTAIRDLPRDAALLVTVRNGDVHLQGISFTGQQLNAIESYNMEYWRKTIAPEQKFNYRLLPYLALQVVLHADFWIGFAGALLLVLLISLLRKRWKRKR